MSKTTRQPSMPARAASATKSAPAKPAAPAPAAEKAMNRLDLVSAVAEEAAQLGLTDTPGVRLLVRGWAAFMEEVVVEWVRDDRGVSRAELLDHLAASLPGILAPLRP